MVISSAAVFFLEPQRQTYIGPTETTTCNRILRKVAAFGVLLGAGRILATYYPSVSLFADAVILSLSAYAFHYISTIDSDTGLDDYRLVEAAEDGNRLMVKLLLFLGANPNVNPSNSALRNGIKREDLVIIRDLLTEGADPNLRGMRNLPPLMEAIEASQDNVVKLLLEHRADPLIEAQQTLLNSIHYAKIIHKQLTYDDKEKKKAAAERILGLLKEYKA